MVSGHAVYQGRRAHAPPPARAVRRQGNELRLIRAERAAPRVRACGVRACGVRACVRMRARRRLARSAARLRLGHSACGAGETICDLGRRCAAGGCPRAGAACAPSAVILSV
jgi:hypothetical protein